MPNYAKSKIYKIVCNTTGETYYGSTTQTLAQRITKHRWSAKNRDDPCSAKNIIDRGNYDIILCEEVCCENKEQLHAAERKWIEENECVNKNIPNRTLKETYEANREKYNQQKREHYYANRERILAEMKAKYHSTKEVI